jgi:tetratricopeptide (TPR) repeat protein
VAARLAALVRRELIRPDQSQIPGDDGFRFRHLLIRDAAYDAIAKATRAELHERFADWLDSRDTPLLEQEELAGYHLEQAHRYRIELGQDATELASRAAGRLAAAGRRAIDRRDLNAARSLLSRALALSEPDDPAVNLRLDLAGAHFWSDLKLANQFASEAAARAAAVGDQQGELRARLRVRRIGFITEPTFSADSLLELAQEARPVFERSGDNQGLVEVWLAIAEVANMRCQFGKVIEAWEQAARYAEGTLQENEGLLASARIDGPTPVTEVLSWLDEQPPEAFPLMVVRAMAEAMLGRFDRARELISVWDQRLVDAGGAPGMTGTRWVVEMLAEDFTAAERLARYECAVLEERGATGAGSTRELQLALTLLELGRDSEATERLAIGEALTAPDDILNEMLTRRVRAKLLARAGKHEQSEQLAREAVAIAEQTDALNDRGDALSDLAEVLQLAGHAADAANELEKALTLYEQKGNVVQTRRTETKLAQLRSS